MLLTISTTHQPATDLGFLLHKHPGKAHVYYPEANEQCCTVAMQLEVDPSSRGQVVINSNSRIRKSRGNRPSTRFHAAAASELTKQQTKAA